MAPNASHRCRESSRRISSVAEDSVRASTGRRAMCLDQPLTVSNHRIDYEVGPKGVQVLLAVEENPATGNVCYTVVALGGD